MGTCLPQNNPAISAVTLPEREVLRALYELVVVELQNIMGVLCRSNTPKTYKRIHKDLIAIYKAYTRYIQHIHLEDIEPRLSWTASLAEDLPAPQLFSILFRVNCQVIRTLSQVEPCSDICCCQCKAAPSWMACNGFLKDPPVFRSHKQQLVN